MGYRYKKKPVIVEAIQWDGEKCLCDEMPDWLEKAFRFGYITKVNTHLSIMTLEGTMCANPDDYIIRGVQGEFYPCKPEIFEKTYEKVD